MDICLSDNVTTLIGHPAQLEYVCEELRDRHDSVNAARKGGAQRQRQSLPALLSLECGHQYYSLHHQHEFSAGEAAAKAAPRRTCDRRLSIVSFSRPAARDFGSYT